MGKVYRKRHSLLLARKRERREKIHRLMAKLEKASAQEKERIIAKLRRLAPGYSRDSV
jgi:hypothetical protein